MKKIILSILVVFVSVPALADWTEKFSLIGDIRLRTEGFEVEGVDSDRWRQRVRARLQLKADVNEKIRAVLRLASGAEIGSPSSNTTSTNVTNDKYGANKAFNLDLAYVSWKLDDHIIFEGGKMKNALYRVGGSDILWDSDWTPEGGQLKFNYDLGSVDLFTNIVGYFLDEDSSGQETSLLGGQLGFKLGDEFKLTFGGGYYAMNTKGMTPLVSSGNTTEGATNVYANDYKLAEAFLKATVNMLDQPLSLYSNYVNNTEADYQRDALLVGVQYGKTKAIGDFKLDFAYRMIKSDSVLGALNDGDFNGGITDGEGYTANIKYMFAENSVLGVKYLTSDRGVSTSQETSFSKYQIDLAFKF